MQTYYADDNDNDLVRIGQVRTEREEVNGFRTKILPYDPSGSCSNAKRYCTPFFVTTNWQLFKGVRVYV
jgi:hypothetical protein